MDVGRGRRKNNVIQIVGIAVSCIGLFFSFVACALLLVDLSYAQSERVSRAWDVVTSHSPQDDLSARSRNVRDSLEYLNRKFDGAICTNWIKRLSIWLTGDDARSCILPEKERASLENQDLTNYNLRAADLGGARLARAILKSAKLHGANLSGANLIEVDFEGAIFANTNLSLADLNNAKNLVATQLNNACIDGPHSPTGPAPEGAK